MEPIDVEVFSAKTIADELNVNYDTVLEAIRNLKLEQRENPSNRRKRGYLRSEVGQIRQEILRMTGHVSP